MTALAALVCACWLHIGEADAQTSASAAQHASLASVDVQSLLKTARSGDAVAQLKMGDLHMQGRGVLHNYSLAAAWYTKAAKGGNAKAQRKLGLMHLRAEGVALS